jgi:hypothetical protein
MKVSLANSGNRAFEYRNFNLLKYFVALNNLHAGPLLLLLYFPSRSVA